MAGSILFEFLYMLFKSGGAVDMVKKHNAGGSNSDQIPAYKSDPLILGTMSFLHGVIFTLTILNIIVHYLRRRKEEEEEEEEKGEKEEEEGEEEYGERGEDSSPSLPHLSFRRFSLDHIRLATNNFDESVVIGEGGFGKVYKGIIDAGADPVAIKRLSFSSSQGVTEFRTELELLSKFRHSHLVSLIGYCEAGREMILVYEYMPAGSLSDHLHTDRRLKRGHSPLSWVQRLNICIDAARGLDYLHTGTSIKERVIHRDVKSSNILLDEHFAAKISDFGLSRIAPVNPRSTNCDYTNRNMGTFGYMDLESFYTRRVTRKSDVYAFGVVLFEALCGRPAVDSSLDEEQWGLAGWAKICVRERTINQIIDPFLSRKILPGCLNEFVKIAYKCLHDRSKNRPTMADVVARLEYALAVQEGRDVVASVESGLALQEGRSSPVLKRQVANPATAHPGALHNKHWTGKMRFTKMMWSLFSPKLPAASVESSTIVAEEDPEVYLGQLKRFSLRELQVATDNFSNKNIVGRGGFGKVYKGRLADGSLVAVKRRKKVRTEGGELQFQREVEMISMAVHCNLLRLRGFCTTPTERLLVYPYMANGSVATFLRERPESQSTLYWPTRKRIALGSANGLAYLHDHCVPKIIHRDVKAANILLDDEFEAVVGDFGLAKLMDNKDTHVTTVVRGTSGFIAPEYLSTGKTSEKTDVFGYGVMLLEVITGQRTYDLARLANDDDVMLLDWVKGLLKEKKLETLVDADLQGNYIYEEVEQLIQVALLCTQDTPMKRPKMSEVVRMLEGYGLTERWEEFQKEMSPQEFYNTVDWIITDSFYNLRPEELSSPR